MTTLKELERCLNCGIRKFNNYKRIASMEVAELTCTHQTILAQWTDQQSLNGGFVCLNCLDKIEKCEIDMDPPRILGHKMICIGCGSSVLRKKYKKTCREEDLQLLFPWYKQLKPSTLLCRSCDIRLRRRKGNIKKELEVKIYLNSEIECAKMESPSYLHSGDKSEYTKPEPAKLEAATFQPHKFYNTTLAIIKDELLILPRHKRVLGRGGHKKCLMPNCEGPGEYKVTRAKRKLLLLQSDILITRRAWLCNHHAQDKWSYNSNTFSINHVEDALSLCERPLPITDFDRVDEMPDHICKYWTGLKVDQFKELYEKLNVDTSQFRSLRNALAAYLLRKKTGDSLLRIANLFLASAKRLSKEILEIERCFKCASDLQTVQ